MMPTYVNPWYYENPGMQPTFHTDKTPIEYRGVLGYQRIPGAWDYVLDGICITQRCGWSTQWIDDVLDGRSVDVQRVCYLINKYKLQGDLK